MRNSQGIAVEALAEKACVGKTTIERWEAKGVGNADIEKVRSVMAVLEYDLRRVLTPECQQEMEQMSQDSGNETLASERHARENPQPWCPAHGFSFCPNCVISSAGRKSC